MKAFSNPTLFSKHFKIDPDELANAGLIDPFLDVDTQLFIDPILLEKSALPLIRVEAHTALRKHFSNVFRLLAISNREGDAPWKAAQRLLELADRRYAEGVGKQAQVDFLQSIVRNAPHHTLQTGTNLHNVLFPRKLTESHVYGLFRPARRSPGEHTTTRPQAKFWSGSGWLCYRTIPPRYDGPF